MVFPVTQGHIIMTLTFFIAYTFKWNASFQLTCQWGFWALVWKLRACKIRWRLGRSEVEGSGMLLYMSLYTEKIEAKVLFFVASQSMSITVHHLLPMHRLFIPPIPLGKISLAAHYPEAVLQSIATQLCLCHFDVSHKIHLCSFIYIRPFMASLIEAYITEQELDEIIVLNRNSLWVWQIVNNQKFPWSFFRAPLLLVTFNIWEKWL